MRPFCKPQRRVVGAGIAAAVLGLSVLSASTHAQNASAPAVAQQAPAGSNADLATRVKTALNADPSFYAKHVNVSIEKGDVVLNGFVQNSREMLDAVDIATKAADGRKVVNNLSIKKTSDR